MPADYRSHERADWTRNNVKLVDWGKAIVEGAKSAYEIEQTKANTELTKVQLEKAKMEAALLPDKVASELRLSEARADNLELEHKKNKAILTTEVLNASDDAALAGLQKNIDEKRRDASAARSEIAISAANDEARQNPAVRLAGQKFAEGDTLGGYFAFEQAKKEIPNWEQLPIMQKQAGMLREQGKNLDVLDTEGNPAKLGELIAKGRTPSDPNSYTQQELDAMIAGKEADRVGVQKYISAGHTPEDSQNLWESEKTIVKSASKINKAVVDRYTEMASVTKGYRKIKLDDGTEKVIKAIDIPQDEASRITKALFDADGDIDATIDGQPVVQWINENIDDPAEKNTLLSYYESRSLENQMSLVKVGHNFLKAKAKRLDEMARDESATLLDALTKEGGYEGFADRIDEIANAYGGDVSPYNIFLDTLSRHMTVLDQKLKEVGNSPDPAKQGLTKKLLEARNRMQGMYNYVQIGWQWGGSRRKTEGYKTGHQMGKELVEKYDILRSGAAGGIVSSDPYGARSIEIGYENVPKRWKDRAATMNHEFKMNTFKALKEVMDPAMSDGKEWLRYLIGTNAENTASQLHRMGVRLEEIQTQQRVILDQSQLEGDPFGVLESPEPTP